MGRWSTGRSTSRYTATAAGHCGIKMHWVRKPTVAPRQMSVTARRGDGPREPCVLYSKSACSPIQRAAPGLTNVTRQLAIADVWKRSNCSRQHGIRRGNRRQNLGLFARHVCSVHLKKTSTLLPISTIHALYTASHQQLYSLQLRSHTTRSLSTAQHNRLHDLGYTAWDSAETRRPPWSTPPRLRARSCGIAMSVYTAKETLSMAPWSS